MNAALKPKTEPMPSNEIREKILAVVDEKHGAFWSDFYDALTIDPLEIQLALNNLVQDGTLRMKEDSTEHEWEYLRNNHP